MSDQYNVSDLYNLIREKLQDGSDLAKELHEALEARDDVKVFDIVSSFAQMRFEEINQFAVTGVTTLLLNEEHRGRSVKYPAQEGTLDQEEVRKIVREIQNPDEQTNNGPIGIDKQI